jgi:hypothetical protein
MRSDGFRLLDNCEIAENPASAKLRSRGRLQAFEGLRNLRRQRAAK